MCTDAKELSKYGERTMRLASGKGKAERQQCAIRVAVSQPQFEQKSLCDLGEVSYLLVSRPIKISTLKFLSFPGPFNSPTPTPAFNSHLKSLIAERALIC